MNNAIYEGVEMKNTKKKSFCKKLSVLAIAALMLVASACSSNGANNDAHIYDNAQIREVLNGSRTEKLGEYSIVEVSSDEVTDEALADWYFNYVDANDFNWCMILYTDENNLGVYATSAGFIVKDTYFEEDEFGDYMMADSADDVESTTYYVEDETIAESDKPESTELVESETNENEVESSDMANEITLGQKNALSSAENYLAFTAFSYSGLIEQLKFEGYSDEDATYAADNCGADWNEQAVKRAKNYLDYTSFSKQGLIDQLVFDGFTEEQATAAANEIGY